MNYLNDIIKKFIDYIAKLDFETNLFLYITRFFILVFIINTIYYIPFTESQRSINNFEKNKGSFYASFITLIVLLGIYIFKFSSQKFKNYTIFISFILIFLIGIHYIAGQLGIYNSIYNETVGYILLGIISIIPLIILFRSIKRHLSNLEGWTGFIINFILYIPCLMNEVLEYLKSQFSITSNITYGLLGLEILLIVAYIFLPNLISNIIKTESISLLEDSYFLGQEETKYLKYISDIYIKTDDDYIKTDDDPIEYKKGKSSYSISLWIYLNQQDPSINSDNIFRYGNESQCFPMITYCKSTTEGKNKLKFHFSSNAPAFDMLIESQKWNNIVLNYNNHVVDLFINGNLVKTCIFEHDTIPIYNYNNDYFSIQSNNINGAICNIKYYKKPLTNFRITNIYNLLNGINPPINNIM